MYQIITLKEPIPSCNIFQLVWKKSRKIWEYQYAIKTPIEIHPGDVNLDLVVYEYISDLDLRHDNKKYEDAVNIHVDSYEDFERLLIKQRKADLEFRKKWFDAHPDAEIPEHSKFVLEHKDYALSELNILGLHFVVGLLKSQDDQHDIFVGA